MIVGFCEPVDVDWRTEYVTMPDALSCYFEAQYDPVNNELLFIWESPRE